MKKSLIMRDIPFEEGDDSVYEYFSEVLDEIRERVVEIEETLRINSVSEIYRIEDAYEITKELRKDLY